MQALQTHHLRLSLFCCAIIHMISGQQVGKMMHGLNMKRSHSHLSSQHTSELLALWIDGKQVERFIGHADDMYLIKGGVVNAYLREPFLMNKLPVMPYDMDFVQLTWKAEKETFRYKFSELRSMNPDLLYNPLLSIPTSGDVPKHQSMFELTIACTRNRSGIAMMSIALNIYNSKYERISGSPLEFHLRKKCEAVDKNRLGCRYVCRNGGRCGDLRKCECRPGFAGHKCEIALCHCENGGTCLDRDRCKCLPGYHGDRCQLRAGQCAVPCKNGGHCTIKNVCSCPEGYTGQFCQRAICHKPCGVHGKCIDVDKCECYRGWRGKQCNKTAKVSTTDEDNEGTVTQRRKRRRQSDQEITKRVSRKVSPQKDGTKKIKKKRKNRNQKAKKERAMEQ